LFITAFTTSYFVTFTTLVSQPLPAPSVPGEPQQTTSLPSPAMPVKTTIKKPFKKKPAAVVAVKRKAKKRK
jgi:hypothetical protein